MSRPVMHILSGEAMELVKLYERCKWLQMAEPSSRKTETAEMELESFVNDINGDAGVKELYEAQLSAVTKERDELRGALERIAEAYRAMFPVDDCPPMPHGCDRCEIHYWLNDVVPLQPGDDA